MIFYNCQCQDIYSSLSQMQYQRFSSQQTQTFLLSHHMMTEVTLMTLNHNHNHYSNSIVRSKTFLLSHHMMTEVTLMTLNHNHNHYSNSIVRSKVPTRMSANILLHLQAVQRCRVSCRVCSMRMQHSLPA
ncbi:uncharacterized protein LOC126991658 isoform X4 [Eriocheir sinensis]|uniref:uncharacterized protein LOC126991656 isoform X2 n=1 Tax=Eriocheir sinensis TaxID=95602 RepID=UPI0021C93883|nr:uncharacterized protein LOC126991656 isoform X2 [Eriocheir sinensis]XP_050706316.1 uncharacterized protein LOC126991656 isoform X3 [Eriocheir sinensis]XP_050706317.1 uncharacterized protein LOC126991656 isoform X4 [Eriocheir sinensis]XP_050706320.1 uncharacterized protein LOC126991658 isoform X2 [Eriocheir sinensis]XP_050706321.1 uncharacterized protein LOC126991658 isoform X3 [Eriocheir sinensis]XP_050706322.1 uncharacterized protein LOC126991658 isoform X4 [Eriocheir sinensis]